MQKLETKLRRLVQKLRHNFFTASNLLAAGVVLICGFFVYGSIGATGHNWELQNKLKNLELESTKLALEVDTLKLEQEFYKSAEYQELMAREKLGKMAEGEKMLILPPNSEAAIQKHKKRDEKSLYERSNFAQWMKLLFNI